MTTVYIPYEKDKILNKIGQNLGINQINDGSYLKTLVDGLHAVNEETVDAINVSINNLYVETADETVLESFGSKKGLSRLKSKNIILNSNDLVAYLKPVFYRETTDLTLTLFKKNQAIKSDIFVITFLEDVVYNSSIDRVYVTCSITINDLYEIPYNLIEQDKVLKLTVPKQHSSLLEGITFNLEKDVYFSNFSESLLSYRERVTSALREHNISGDAHVNSVMNSIPFVDQFYVEPDSYPTSIFVLNNNMYSEIIYDYLLDDAAIALGTSLVNQVKSYGSSFVMKRADRISLSLSLDVEVGTNAGYYLQDLPDYIIKNHILGSEMIINKNVISEFFKENGMEETKFNLEISLIFNGIAVLNEDTQSIKIQKNQYPHFSRIVYNGEVLDDV